MYEVTVGIISEEMGFLRQYVYSADKERNALEYTGICQWNMKKCFNISCVRNLQINNVKSYVVEQQFTISQSPLTLSLDSGPAKGITYIAETKR